MLTSLAYNLRTQSHSFVIGPLLGAAALADLHASRVLVTPAVIAIPPLSQVLMPRLAEARRDGQSSMKRMTVVSIALQASVAATYCVVLLPLLPLIVPRVLGDAYAHVEPLVTAWGAVVLLMAIRTGLTMALEAVRAFRDLLFINIVVAVVTLMLAVGFSSTFGSIGAIAAIGISELLLCVGLFGLYKSRIQVTRSPDARGICRERPRQTDRHSDE